MIRFLVFMGIWMVGCAIVVFAFSAIANAWKMTIGALTGLTAALASDVIEFKD